MVNGTVTILIVVSTILIVSHYVGKVQLDKYAGNPVKQYLIRASIGLPAAFLLASLLFIIFAWLGN